MGDHDVRRKPRSAGRDQSELGLLAVDGARAVVVLDELDDLRDALDDVGKVRELRAVLDQQIHSVSAALHACDSGQSNRGNHRFAVGGRDVEFVKQNKKKTRCFQGRAKARSNQTSGEFVSLFSLLPFCLPRLYFYMFLFYFTVFRLPIPFFVFLGRAPLKTEN